jgi:hypothetical protein
MHPVIRKILFWAPRILCILTALFFMLFSLDVFDEYKTFGEIAVGLFMHNLPSIGMLLLLWASWRREWIGGTFNLALAIYWVFAFGIPRHFPFVTYLGVTGPLLTVSILFWINWFLRAQIRGAGEPPTLPMIESN